MDILWSDPNTVTAIATVILALFTFTAFLVACYQLRILVNNSNRQTRPYVYADVVPGLQSMGCWDLVISNVGRSMALEVKIALDPLPAATDSDGFAKRVLDFISHTYAFPPGTQKRIMWRMDHKKDDERTQLGANEVTTIHVSYKNDRGRSYSQAFLVDLTGYGPAVPRPFTGSQREGEGKELHNINQRLEAINIHLGELRR